MKDYLRFFRRKRVVEDKIITNSAIKVSSSPELLKKMEEYAKEEMPKFSKAFERLARE